VPVTSISIKSGDPRCICPKCGGRLHRLARRGFFQNGVFPHFGYYPWECFSCRKTKMLRARGRYIFHPIRDYSLAESPELPRPLQPPQHKSAPSYGGESFLPLKEKASAPPKAKATAPPDSESSPPLKAAASTPQESASLPLLTVQTPLPQEMVSSQVLKAESSDFPKSGPLRSMKAEALHSPKRESLAFRKRDSSRSLNALPPVSEAAIRRAIFVEDSSPGTANSPAARPTVA
jgi:hypothetical protein